MIVEIDIPMDSLPNKNRPKVPGLFAGDIVIGNMGRRMRILNSDEWVIIEGRAAGPYCRLQAIDDDRVVVIWPRSWYCKHGESLELNFQ